MLGLTLLDWAVIGVYVAGVTWLGLRIGRGVKTSGDYFMGGRRFGKLLMIAQAFGTGTRTSQVVAVSGGAAQQGFAAIWFQWIYLFSTPFYWLLAPVYRRLRYITIGDFFDRRYGPGLGAAYAVVGLLYFAVTTGVMLRGAGVTISAATGGAVSTEAAVFAMVAFFVAYSLFGGLVAAITTQAVQGLFILALSFLLIPFALAQTGGFAGTREALPEGTAWFSLVASEEITLFYILMGVVNALVGSTVQPHHMAINGAGKDEIACRTGWTYGNFLKRFATVGWALSGVLLVAALPLVAPDLSDRGTREAAFGLAARELLPSGLVGLLVAAVAAAVVAGASAFMVNGSALFTRNVWGRFAPEATEAQTLTVGRTASVAVVALGVIAALTLQSVIGGLEFLWKLMAFLGIPFWAALFWRRANRWGAWASLAATGLCFVFTGGMIGEAWSFPAQVALYLPVGIGTLVAVSLATRPEPDDVLNSFHSLLNTPVGEEVRLEKAGVEIVHEGGISTDPADVVPTVSASGPRREVPLLDDAPAAERGASLFLTHVGRWRPFSWTRYHDDLTGFAIAWGIVAMLLGSVYALVTVLG
ncbi:MAG: sodium:solute symporter family protein [Bacteroidota bacterium]